MPSSLLQSDGGGFIHMIMVGTFTMAIAQIKGVKKTTFLEKEFFLDSDFRNGISNNYN